jgi:carbon monoxide dehydrogenase subunit G
MEMSSTRSVPADVATTWRCLNDPDFLRDCIPGCESIESLSDSEYKVVMSARVGPVNARFNGKMTLSDLDPPRAYSLSFEGQGGAAGFAKGGARVELAPQDEGGTTTAMTYRVKAQVGGKLAQIGSRLVDGAARKVADDFFAAFVAKIAASAPGEAGLPVPITPEPRLAAPAPGIEQAPAATREPQPQVEPAAAEAAAGAEVGAAMGGGSAAAEVVSAPRRRRGLTRNKVILWAVLVIVALVLWIVARSAGAGSVR